LEHHPLQRERDEDEEISEESEEEQLGEVGVIEPEIVSVKTPAPKKGMRHGKKPQRTSSSDQDQEYAL